MDLYISNDKELYQELENRKEEIEKQLGEKLVWAELPDRKASLIGVYKKGDFRDEEQAPQLIEWIHGQAESFAQVFKKHIR
jgi:hypothetical protein